MHLRKAIILASSLAIAIAWAASLVGPSAAAQRPTTRAGLTSAAKVQVDGKILTDTTLGGSIALETEVIQYQDGADQKLRSRPGNTTRQPVTLRVTQWSTNHVLYTLWQESTQGKQTRKDMTVQWLDRGGQVARQVNLPDSWISGVSVATNGSVTVTVQPGDITFN